MTDPKVSGDSASPPGPGFVGAPLTGAQIAELDAYITEAMEVARVPGAQVAIVQQGAVVHTRGFGVREVGRPAPVTPQTPMMIGSTGKTMTTMMMATVVDAPAHGLGDTTVEILPSFAVADPETTGRIRMRDLVSASTGMPRRDAELIFNSTTLSAEELIRSLRTFVFTTAFGEVYQYNNQMVAAGGYLRGACGRGPGRRPAPDLHRGDGGPDLRADRHRKDDVLVRSRPRGGRGGGPHGINLSGSYVPMGLVIEENLVGAAIPSGGSWSDRQAIWPAT